MFTAFFTNLHQVDVGLFLTATILFILGLWLSPVIVNYQFRWLLVFPEWILKVTKKLTDLHLSFPFLLLFIFVFNNISLFFNLLIGTTVFLPFFAAIFTGINLGVVAYQSYGTRGIFVMILNPVSIFELPAAWISLALGMDVASAVYSASVYQVSQQRFSELLPVYVAVVMPLLFLGALVEAGMISFFQNNSNQNEEMKAPVV